MIIGVDEVGVGPLAGPVVACAAAMPEFFTLRNISGAVQEIQKLKDSKKLSQKQRENFLKYFEKERDVFWEIAGVSNTVIDRINIYEARQLAAKRAVMRLEKSLKRKADIILLDGRNILKIARRQEAIVKGDEKIALCAIASIVAKITRDGTMVRYHKKYPQYRFDLHKGYGTKLHYEMIKQYGPCPIHRRSFHLGLSHLKPYKNGST